MTTPDFYKTSSALQAPANEGVHELGNTPTPQDDDSSSEETVFTPGVAPPPRPANFASVRHEHNNNNNVQIHIQSQQYAQQRAVPPHNVQHANQGRYIAQNQNRRQDYRHGNGGGRGTNRNFAHNVNNRNNYYGNNNKQHSKNLSKPLSEFPQLPPTPPNKKANLLQGNAGHHKKSSVHSLGSDEMYVSYDTNGRQMVKL